MPQFSCGSRNLGCDRAIITACSGYRTLVTQHIAIYPGGRRLHAAVMAHNCPDVVCDRSHSTGRAHLMRFLSLQNCVFCSYFCSLCQSSKWQFCLRPLKVGGGRSRCLMVSGSVRAGCPPNVFCKSIAIESQTTSVFQGITRKYIF